jgi:superfamily II DNA or RNA helicase
MPSRRFSPQARRWLAVAQDGLCTWCGQPLDGLVEADHRQRWSEGYPTDLWNGQLLHRHCHIEKERITMTLRPWQRDMLAIFREHDEQVFVPVAPPGAGKTDACMAAYSSWTTSARNPLLIIVSPSVQILRGWAIRSVSYGKTGVVALDARERKIHKSGKKFPLLPVTETIPSDMNVVLCTYGALSGMAEIFRRACRQREIFAICDEPHHAGGGNDPRPWGSASLDAFEHASKIVVPTATPWRSVGTSPAWFESHYDANGALLPEYRLLRYDAIAAGYIRNVDFTHWDGEGHWDRITLETNERRARSSMMATGSDPDLALAANINDEDFIEAQLRETYREMEYRRVEEHHFERAKMLVIADGVENGHVRNICRIANGLWGTHSIFAVQATGDDPRAHQIIDSFREGRGRHGDFPRCLVSYGMVAEGCDIPDLVATCWLTRRRTALILDQAASGRNSRKTAYEDKHMSAATILPAHPEITAWAQTILREQIPPLREDHEPEGPNGDGTDPKSRVEFGQSENIQLHGVTSGEETASIGAMAERVMALAEQTGLPSFVVHKLLVAEHAQPPHEERQETNDDNSTADAAASGTLHQKVLRKHSALAMKLKNKGVQFGKLTAQQWLWAQAKTLSKPTLKGVKLSAMTDDQKRSLLTALDSIARMHGV